MCRPRTVARCSSGRSCWDPAHRRLTRDGEAVKLGSRQFDLLVYLARNAGRVVDKDELMSAVWGGRIVEESNLSQAVFGLRRALDAGDGDSVIQTAPGRGLRVHRFGASGAMPAREPGGRRLLR